MILEYIRTIRIVFLLNLTFYFLGLLDREFEILSWRSNIRRIIIFVIKSACSLISLATLNIVLASLVSLIFPR
jgi:hypothetical protein